MTERDRLAALLRRFDQPDLDGYPAFEEIAARLLAAGVRVGDAGLDVERLTAILPRILLDSTNNSMADPDGEMAKDWGRDVAAAIAREYAALAGEPER
jgi:hypothetical protein